MFNLQKAEETATRTFRIPLSLLEKMSKTAQEEKISLNSLVVQCCSYALDELQKQKSDKSKSNLEETGK